MTVTTVVFNPLRTAKIVVFTVYKGVCFIDSYIGV